MEYNVILFVMGSLRPVPTQKDQLPIELYYRFESSAEAQYPGVQSNEAPIKYLIKAGKDAGHPVTHLLYLCSEACLVPNISVALAKTVIPDLKAAADVITTEEFVLERIRNYCEENNCYNPMATAIPFNPLRPADSLDELASALGTGARISIDTTSGPRDSVILLTLASQIIKMGGSGTSIGDIVYANLSEKAIYRQNNTFDLIDLINAIDSFTDYGRADQLKSFFDINPYIKEPTRQLCKSMEEFSDSLALCQLGNIEEKVLHVQRNLDAMENELGKLKERYKLYSDAIEQIDAPSPIRSRTFEEAMNLIERLHPDIDFNSPEKKELVNTLERLREPVTIIRSELLFLSLIPTIREKFINPSSVKSDLIPSIIRWCVERKMIQQALGVFREYIPQFVVDKGFIASTRGRRDAGSLLKALSNASAIEASEYVDLAKIDEDIERLFANKGLVQVSESERDGLREAHLLRYPQKYILRDRLSIDETRVDQLSAILVWFRYLWLIRNFTMHVVEPDDRFSDFFKTYEELYGSKHYPEQFALVGIQHDITLALNVFDSFEYAESNAHEWESIIDEMMIRAKTITTEELDGLMSKLRTNFSGEQSYIFEDNIDMVAELDRLFLMKLIASKDSRFRLVPCICVLNKSEEKRRQKNYNPSSWDDSWAELRDKAIAFCIETDRDFIAWDAFRAAKSLPTKQSLGFGNNAKQDSGFKRLPEKFPDLFRSSLCLKYLGSGPNSSFRKPSPRVRNNNTSQPTRKAKPKAKGGAKQRRSDKPKKKLGVSISGRMDAATIEKMEQLKNRL